MIKVTLRTETRTDKAKGSGQGEASLCGGQNPPLAWRQSPKFQFADPHPDEPQCGVADGCSHAADLAIFSFDHLQGDPASRDSFAKADGRLTWRKLGLWLEPPSPAGERLSALDDLALDQPLKRFGGRNAFELDPILTRVRMVRLEELLVESGFVAQQKQAFGIGVQPADWVKALGKPELGQGRIRRTVGAEL